MNLSKSVLTVLALLVTSLAPAFAAEELVELKGTANGVPCEVSYSLERDGFLVTGFAVSGDGTRFHTDLDVRGELEAVSVNYMNGRAFGHMGFDQTRMVMEHGVVLHSYRDLSLVEAKETKLEIRGHLRQPQSVTLVQTKLVGPIAKIPVSRVVLECTNLR